MFKNLNKEIKYMLSYGNLKYHLRSCLLWNEFWIYPINWLPPSHRYIGFGFTWYDGPHYDFGFWYFNITSSPDNSLPKEPEPNSIQFIKDNYFKNKFRHLKNIIAKLNKGK